MIDLVSYTNPGMNAIILVMVFAIFLGIGLLLVLTPVYAFHAPPPASLYYYFTNDPTLGYHDYDHDEDMKMGGLLL